MEVSPQAIATTTFRVVKKGYDPDEVRSYLGELSRAMDTAQSHAQTMEARARQAMAKAERLATATPTTQTSAPTEAIAVTPSTPPIEAQPLPSGADTISRTLLLAQQTAEEAVAKAEKEAAELRAAAEAEAKSLRENAQSDAAKAVETARHDARAAGDEEKARIEGEIHQLLARLEFLRGDIDQLEKHSATHRQRLLESSDALRAVAEQPNGGFTSARRPVLSGAADSLRADFAERAAAEATADSGSELGTDGGSDADEASESAEPATASLFDSEGEPAAEALVDADSAESAGHGDVDITAEVPIVHH